MSSSVSIRIQNIASFGANIDKILHIQTSSRSRWSGYLFIVSYRITLTSSSLSLGSACVFKRA